MTVAIAIDHEKIAEFCRTRPIQRLSLFGSVLGDRFRPDSDVDALVDLLPGHEIGLMELAAMQLELSAILGREVDLKTPGFLSRYFREDVIASAEILFERE